MLKSVTARVAVIFENIGPYHAARLNSLSKLCHLTVIELRSKSQDYSWSAVSNVEFNRISLGVGTEGALSLEKSLDDAQPDVLFVPGWGTRDAIMALLWADTSGVPVIIMSDSQHHDSPRNFIQEWMKSRLIQHVSGCLVAGQSHAQYCERLGLRHVPLRFGYDVVDNDYFFERAQSARDNKCALRAHHGLPSRYILTCARFIDKKNLFRLVDGFEIAITNLKKINKTDGYPHLVILGEGYLFEKLEQYIRIKSLDKNIIIYDFQQYSVLPDFYALAESFILASTSEQWGLVVNEAMASGLPILVSNVCGSGKELVSNDINGFSFDPFNVNDIADSIQRISLMSSLERKKMGEESVRIISEWSPDKFSNSCSDLIAEAMDTRPNSMNFFGRLVAKILVRWIH
jgi:1,2-diacylglycerol 3-alpha-glucosyltransferase